MGRRKERRSRRRNFLLRKLVLTVNLSISTSFREEEEEEGHN